MMMKKYVLISVMFFVSIPQTYGQTDYQLDYYLSVNFFDKGKKGKISAEDCKAVFIIQKDTITIHPASMYNIKYPIKNSKLIINYKDFYTEINTDKYLDCVFGEPQTVYINILLHPKNEQGGYFIAYDGAITYVEEYGTGKRKKHFHNIIFCEFPETPYPRIE